MRVVHETPDLLIVAERAVGLRVCGTVLGVAGTGLVAMGARIGSGTAGVLGACMLLLGTMLVLLPAFSTFYFNRGEKRLIVARRRVWTRGERGYTEYPLRDVNAVNVEQSTRGDGDNTWRVVVRLADGRSVPFTSYFTSGYRTKAATTGRVARFLGVATNSNVQPGPGSPHAIKPESTRVAVGIGLVAVAGGALFGAIGATGVAAEYGRLTTWQPVQATVLDKRVDIHRSPDETTYRPEITYRYSVNGNTYTSSRTLPIKEGRGGKWAYGVIKPFVVGRTYPAWYDPANPSDAFIVRTHAVIPPIFVGIGLFVMLGGLAAVAFSLRQRREMLG